MAEHLRKYDLVIVIDYGHGFLSGKLIKTLVAHSKFLAVNAQTNSGNAGFNFITKYPRGDFVCINELEARLAMQDDTSKIEEILIALHKRLSAKKMIVTLGNSGSLAYEEGTELIKTPILSNDVIAPVGAGDAFLAFSAPCAAANFSLELVALIGTMTSSIAVNILGNKSSVERDDLFKHLGYLLD